jgi:hypothetical protein
MILRIGSSHACNKRRWQCIVAFTGPAPACLKVVERLIAHERCGVIGDPIEHVDDILAPQLMGRKLAEDRFYGTGLRWLQPV